MYGYIVLSQKIVQRAVGIQRTESIELGNIFHRQITGLTFVFFAIAVVFNGSKPQRVVLALQCSGIKQVVGTFHKFYFF